MFYQHYAASTVNTYVSALCYTHKLFGFPDPTKVFFIIQMLKGLPQVGRKVGPPPAHLSTHSSQATVCV